MSTRAFPVNKTKVTTAQTAYVVSADYGHRVWETTDAAPNGGVL
jgi:hypothetical protein